MEGETSLEAWRVGAALLLKSGCSLNNLITTIASPCLIDPMWLTALSPHEFSSKGDNIRDVVNTIFPIKIAGQSTCRGDLYSEYLRCHDRAHKWRRGRHTWGTYFERLTRFPSARNKREVSESIKRENVNQLERVIEKLRSWRRRSTTGLVFHLSSPVFDTPRTRGGPCWHYGELLWNHDDSIDLVAVYRNHDFYNKVLGNFIGLGLLLKYICNESDKVAGKLICHSVHAYCDSSARQALLNMVA